MRKLTGAVGDIQKLDYKKAEEIRGLYKEGLHRRAIADRYGVSYRTVNDILANRTWKKERWCFGIPLTDTEAKICCDMIGEMLDEVIPTDRGILSKVWQLRRLELPAWKIGEILGVKKSTVQDWNRKIDKYLQKNAELFM